MPAYAYPIEIQTQHQVIRYTTEHRIDSDPLTLADLAFTEGCKFSIECPEDDTAIGMLRGDGYIVTVYRERLETDAERDTRVARERSYMAEYNRRATAGG